MNNKILVTNLYPKANAQVVGDFFSFCGSISSLKLQNNTNEAKAIIEFETEAAATTALLLTNALIGDRPIVVEKYVEEKEEMPKPIPVLVNMDELNGVDPSNAHEPVAIKFTDVPADKIPSKNHSVPANERTKVSVIASLIASGYSLGLNSLSKAKELDEKAAISSNINAGVDVLRTRAQELDQQLGITNATNTIGQQISQGWQQFDQNLGVSEKTTTATAVISESFVGLSESAKESANNISTSLMQNPTVSNTVNTMSQWGQSISSFFQPAGQAVSQSVAEIKEDTAKLIEIENMQRSANPNTNNNNNSNNNNNNNNNFDANPPPYEMQETDIELINTTTSTEQSVPIEQQTEVNDFEAMHSNFEVEHEQPPTKQAETLIQLDFDKEQTKEVNTASQDSLLVSFEEEDDSNNATNNNNTTLSPEIVTINFQSENLPQ